MELTTSQIERQDLVDNAIYNLMLKLNPVATPIDWNIEHIAKVRGALTSLFVNDLKLCDETSFYPYLEEV